MEIQNVGNETSQSENRAGANAFTDENQNFYSKIDSFTLEALAELKISRFLDMVGSHYPEDLHKLIMSKVEKPLMKEVLKRKGGNQVQAALTLGINRNTLRKKMRIYELI